MKASIVIPAYRPNHLLSECLNGIIMNTDLSTVEIIVVCNGSEKDSIDTVVGKGQSFRLVWYEEAIGFTRAANVGFKLATADVCIIMNTDSWITAQPKNDWINRLVDPFHNQKIAVTGLGMMWTEYGPFLPFFCCGIRRRLFYELGYLDEAFNPGYCEDADFCYRCAAAGYEIKQIDDTTPDFTNHRNITDFPIYHPGEGSFTDKVKRQECVNKGYRLLCEKWGKK